MGVGVCEAVSFLNPRNVLESGVDERRCQCLCHTVTIPSSTTAATVAATPSTIIIPDV